MKTAKLFKNGQSQAVRLPKEFRIPGKEVYIQERGGAIILLPVNASWSPLLDSLDKFDPNEKLERNQPTAQQKREAFLK